MSDPVSNVEIEDLSSIRRLLSEDARPKPEVRPAYSDKLVLTPALRVTDEPVESLPEAEVAPAVDASQNAAEMADVPLMLGRDLSAPNEVTQEADQSGQTPEQDDPAPYVDVAEDSLGAEQQPSVGAQAAAEHIKADVANPGGAGAFVLSEALRNILQDEDPADEPLAELEDAAASDVDNDPLTELTETAEEDDASFDAALASFIEADVDRDQIVDDATPQEPEAFAPEETAEDITPAVDRPKGSITTQSILSQLVEQEVSRALNEGFDDALYEDAGPKSPMPPTFEEIEAAEGADPDESSSTPEVEPILARRAAHLSLVTSMFDAAPDTSDTAKPDEQILEQEPEQDDPADAAAQGTAEDAVPEAELIEETATIAEETVSQDTSTASRPDGDTLEQKIAQLENLVASRDDLADDAGRQDAIDAEDLDHVQDVEDAELVDEDVAGTPFFHRSATLDWQDAEPEAEQVVPAKDPEETPPVQAPALDEAALRDMVADIIREELKGVLGERITRNVRKLVRREIHRVITSQELE